MYYRFIIIVVIGYLLGNVSFAKMFSKKKAKNIEQSGSGNPGAMNMLRTHGALLSFFTLLFDALKAAVPAMLAHFWITKVGGGESLAEIALFTAGLAAVLGHIYPVVNKFKGGKGIASTFGVFMVANPLVAGILFLISFTIFYFVKIGSLASMIFIVSFGIYRTIHAIQLSQWVPLALFWVIIIIDIYAHRENIKRLIANTERITSFKEGVKRDIENMRERNLKKMQAKLEKEEIIENKFKHKIDKKTHRLEKKLNKKLNKNAKRVRRVEKKVDKKTNRMLERSERLSKIWWGLTSKLNKDEKDTLADNTIDNPLKSSKENITGAKDTATNKATSTTKTTTSKTTTKPKTAKSTTKKE